MVVGIGAYAPAFSRPDSLIGVLNDTGFLFMMALAQMIVILTRGIDLSVAANLALDRHADAPCSPSTTRMRR